MDGVDLVRDATRARLATAIGIPLYTVFGGIGLWLATALWHRVVCSELLVPSVLGGTTSALGAVSAVAALVGVGGAASAFEHTFARMLEPTFRGILAGAGIGIAAAIGPSALIVIGSHETGAGIAVTTVALVIPSALTGAVGVTLLGPVSRSHAVWRLFLAAKWFAVVLIGLWAVLAFAPIERWMPLGCGPGLLLTGG